jgi:hypothetical protein
MLDEISLYWLLGAGDGCSVAQNPSNGFELQPDFGEYEVVVQPAGSSPKMSSTSSTTFLLKVSFVCRSFV